MIADRLARLDAARDHFAALVDKQPAPTLPFSPLTWAEIIVRVRDANETIAYAFRGAVRNGRQLDDYDMARMTEAAEIAEMYGAASSARSGVSQ